MIFSDAINRLADHQDLTTEEASGVMDVIMDGRASQAQIGAFLLALRMKGETPREIAAFAVVMRRHAVPVRPSVEGMLVDTCGTGGTAAGRSTSVPLRHLLQREQVCRLSSTGTGA